MIELVSDLAVLFLASFCWSSSFALICSLFSKKRQKEEREKNKGGSLWKGQSFFIIVYNDYNECPIE